MGIVAVLPVQEFAYYLLTFYLTSSILFFVLFTDLVTSCYSLLHVTSSSLFTFLK